MNFGLILLLLSACSTPQPVPTATPLPTATPAPPTDTPTPETSEWNYVALGEGFAFASLYAKHIEDDLGVKVKVYLAGSVSTTTAQLLEHLRNDQALRERLSEAEVVTVVFGDNEMGEYLTGPCAGVENLPECISTQLTTTFAPNLDAIFGELLTLCKPSTIIRTMSYYSRNIGWQALGDTQSVFGDVTLNDCILEAAAKHNIPVAPVHEAFNGPAGDEDPIAKGYCEASGGLNAVGAAKIAETFQEVGYEPTIP
jgi:hypothetical protein